MEKLKNLIFLGLVLILSCKAQTNAKTNSISSKHHDISITYSNPWVKVIELDTKEESFIGVINYNDGTSYSIKAGKDTSKEEITDEKYYEYTRNLMLKENPRNRLLEEKEVPFHDKKFYQQIFLLYTKRWGLLKHYYLGHRTGDFYYGVQISFPVSEKNSVAAEWPRILSDLDKNVLIQGK